jgi:phosphoribosylformylglycinamidine synthase II
MKNPLHMKTSQDTETIWRFSVQYRDGFRDAEAEAVKHDAADLGIQGIERVSIARIYYLIGVLDERDRERLSELVADPITQMVRCEPVDLSALTEVDRDLSCGWVVEVAYRPGVRDPVEDSLKKGAKDLGVTSLQAVHTSKAYTFFGSIGEADLKRLCDKLLVNATIQWILTPSHLQELIRWKSPQAVSVETVPLCEVTDTALIEISRDHQLSLNREEMQAIQAYFRRQGREPTLIELETLAQTWSEHCKHKTLRGPVLYTEEVAGRVQKRTFSNLLKETIMRVTEELAKPWCVSVFTDNAGIVRFDEAYHVCFKVETHNHPSALEPFGGASTGIGGVIRDILGTGLGAKPIASCDVFCVADPDLPMEKVPEGALHPKRILRGVVAGVKDYGNKMGIPTVNGAVLFDERFVGNPLVFCGNVGLLPSDKVKKRVAPGMAIVLVGGRTGRDGIHGATFSSLALTQESEWTSAASVQIGDPVTEKKLADALLQARDEGLFASVTDCGAGGLSSAVGEMGAGCGAKVHLEKVPLKYAGLSPTEIWISESQERMVLAVEQDRLGRLLQLFQEREVEATPIGEFTDSGKLELFYHGKRMGELEMSFLHEGVPRIPRVAHWVRPQWPTPHVPWPQDCAQRLLDLLRRWDTCSKEWIVRQYDHEVQGGSVLKPIGLGPSDAAVVRPRLDSFRAVILANGIAFRYGDLDPYWMAACAVDEVVRQVVAVGGSLDRLAILDNFCWGDPTRPEVLGSLVRAALGCSDAALAFGTPFISGKDSLYNEYRWLDRTIQIPGTLLISGLGVVEDARRVISMEAKRPGDFLYIVGWTRKELGGSAYYDLLKIQGGEVPRVDFEKAPRQLRTLADAIRCGWVRAAHDCSEGGVAVAAAEMAFSGGLGLTLDLRSLPLEGDREEKWREDEALFSESASRLLVEVPPEHRKDFEEVLAGFPVGCLGRFDATDIFRVIGFDGRPILEVGLDTLRQAWMEPFRSW